MVPFLALGGAILMHYTHYNKAVVAWLVFSVFSAFYTGVITGDGIMAVAVLAAVLFMMQSARAYPEKKCSHLLYFVTVIILCALIVMKVFPGFNSISFAEDVLLSPQSRPFSITLGYGKALVATLLLIFILEEGPIANSWRKILPTTLAVSIVTVIVVLPLGVLFNIIAYEPKFQSIFFTWAVIHLFSTVIIEEVFFRGILQKKLSNFLTGKTPHGSIWSILIIAFIFALAHAAGGVLYMILVFIAGCGYGAAYKVGGIEAAIGAHLMVNATHLILFTYPMLATYQPWR